MTIITGFVAATGASVAWLAARSTDDIRRCAIVGAVYGLAIGIADSVLTSMVAIGLPPESEGATRIGARIWPFVLVVVLIDVGSKILITIIGLAWARRIRPAS